MADRFAQARGVHGLTAPDRLPLQESVQFDTTQRAHLLGLGLAATNCLNSFSYGYDRLRFIKPVFIGDTIYTIRENLSKVVHNETMGKLKVSYSVYKGEGELVLYAEHLLTALYRDPAPFADQARAAMAAKEAARG